ncbi:hypothetical protein LX36DRAFT_486721 [Colletotrichum falcatum]|nr:hypothetical protein LX36DRAFT_486721 [Colletotrichum falcatum]
MRTAIIKVLAAALVAGVAEACASYNQCRCTMADNTINDTLTQQACDYLNVEAGAPAARPKYMTQTQTYGGDYNNTVQWCISGAGVDNCSMREACAHVNATGPDSWCENRM